MDDVKRVHKDHGRVRVVSMVGRFGYFVQAKQIPIDTAGGTWRSVAHWDYLANAKHCAKFIHAGISGGFISDVAPR